MRLDGYVRVSRIGGRAGETFISPAVQRERIAAYAAAHTHEILLVHEDLDEPGSRYERPAFQDALERVESGQADGVIVASLDRFARSVPDAAVALRRLEAAGGILISVRDALDTSTPVGRFARTMMLAIAELELERIRENWQTAQARAVARGVHIASRTPTGYLRRDDGRLEPDPRAAPIVRELYRRRAAGAGWSELSALLDERGLVGPYANRAWAPSSVQAIVRNRVYLGEARSGQHVNPDAHPPIVTRSEWETAQGPGGTTRGGSGMLLSGLIRCSGCRYVAKADTMRDRDGARLGIYRCRRRHPGGVCPEPIAVMARVVEPYVEAAFLAALESGPVLAEAELARDALEDAVRVVEAAEAELDAYRDETLVSVVGRQGFQAGLEVRARRVASARDELARARETSALATAVPLTPGELLSGWPRLGLGERRAILAAAIDCVMIRRVRGSGRSVPIGERAVILWRGLGPSDLPRRGRRVPLASFVWPDERPDELGMAGA